VLAPAASSARPSSARTRSRAARRLARGRRPHAGARTHIFPARADLEAALAASGLRARAVVEDRLVEWHPDARAVLRSLKEVGASSAVPGRSGLGGRPRRSRCSAATTRRTGPRAACRRRTTCSSRSRSGEAAGEPAHRTCYRWRSRTTRRNACGSSCSRLQPSSHCGPPRRRPRAGAGRDAGRVGATAGRDRAGSPAVLLAAADAALVPVREARRAGAEGHRHGRVRQRRGRGGRRRDPADAVPRRRGRVRGYLRTSQDETEPTRASGRTT